MISVSAECYIKKSWKNFLRSGRNQRKVKENESRNKVATLTVAYLLNVRNIIRCLLLKYRMLFLRVLKVFDEREPLSESTTDRREKYQPVFQKRAPDNIFIVKSKNSTPGVKSLEFKSNRKN